MNKHGSLNRAYRIIWSYAKQCLVVVSELAKSHGKPSGERSLNPVILAESRHPFYSTDPPPLIGFKLKQSKYPVSLMGGLSLMTAAVSVSVPSGVYGGSCTTGPYTSGATGCTNTGSITSLINSGGNITANGTVTSSAGSTISGTNRGIYSSGTIDTLSNGGTITGAYYGIYNSTGGTIGTLSNSISSTIIATQTIFDSYAAIHNSGSISSLNNSGMIIGHFRGVSNDGGMIGTLTNSGGTIYAADRGIDNGGGTIGALINTGAILSNNAGLFNNNSGFIGSLDNSGTISGQNRGILNQAVIGSVINQTNGLIRGANTGYKNEGGTIGLLANSGTIIGTNQYGISSDRSISSIVNQGTITGLSAAIDNSGTIGVLNNLQGAGNSGRSSVLSGNQHNLMDLFSQH